MLHVRIDDAEKADASETLMKVGLTVADAMRILLTRLSTRAAALAERPKLYRAGRDHSAGAPRRAY